MSYLDILKPHLRKEESVRRMMYKCPAGKNTIGCGHNSEASPLPPEMQSFLIRRGYITDEMIETFLDKDIDIAEADARKLYPTIDDFTENRQAAIVDLLFNMGVFTFKTVVHTIEVVRRGDWVLEAAELRNSRWYEQVKARGPKIVDSILEG